MPDTKRKIGARYERIAGEYLIRKGYEILEYNFRCRSGEIDLIARRDGCIIFCEVKYRAGKAAGNPLEAVNFPKQRKISRCAKYYLYQNHLGLEVPCRFDVIGILGDEITHVENAFAYVE